MIYQLLIYLGMADNYNKSNNSEYENISYIIENQQHKINNFSSLFLIKIPTKYYFIGYRSDFKKSYATAVILKRSTKHFSSQKRTDSRNIRPLYVGFAIAFVSMYRGFHVK